ncbi:MAG: VRR-NUC domain-containing protein [Clostridium celatum]|nr:VRR-NUC domain-containing protein [Clostridium celatum]
MTEAQEQRFLFQWAGYSEQKYPELKLLHHIPNGGKRDARTAANLKKEGVKAGVPDIFLPVGRGGYLGLYIELKVGKNKTSLKQKEWIEKLRQQGYRVEVCYGWLEAKEEIEQYMKWENTLKAIDYTKFL